MPLPGPHKLNELHAAIRACTLCLEAGYQIVPCGIVCGRIGARVMVIGQASGITEWERFSRHNVLWCEEKLADPALV